MVACEISHCYEFHSGTKGCFYDPGGIFLALQSVQIRPAALLSPCTQDTRSVYSMSVQNLIFFLFFTTESEGEGVDYWFDVTNWSFCKHALQSRLWRQTRSRATPLLNRSWTKDAWFFESFQAYKMAGFVRRRKKWPRCVSNECKASF